MGGRAPQFNKQLLSWGCAGFHKKPDHRRTADKTLAKQELLHCAVASSLRGAFNSGGFIPGSSQSVTDTKRYDAFGMLVASSGSNPTPFGFVGGSQYQTDANSGLMLLGHRYYDASIGRFISRDPAYAGTNYYAYCENNPLGGTDPEGLIRLTVGYSYAVVRMPGANWGDGGVFIDLPSINPKSWGIGNAGHVGVGLGAGGGFTFGPFLDVLPYNTSAKSGSDPGYQYGMYTDIAGGLSASEVVGRKPGSLNPEPAHDGADIAKSIKFGPQAGIGGGVYRGPQIGYVQVVKLVDLKRMIGQYLRDLPSRIRQYIDRQEGEASRSGSAFPPSSTSPSRCL